MNLVKLYTSIEGASNLSMGIRAFGYVEKSRWRNRERDIVEIYVSFDSIEEFDKDGMVTIKEVK